MERAGPAGSRVVFLPPKRVGDIEKLLWLLHALRTYPEAKVLVIEPRKDRK